MTKTRVTDFKTIERWRIPKGTLIKCPNPYCCETIGRLTQDIKQGDPLRSSAFEGPHIRYGERPRCLKCNHLWYFEEQGASGRILSRLSTGRGWQPTEDRIQANE